VREQRLSAFVSFVRDHLRGDEKGEAQVFLDRLFQAFGQRGAIEAGAVYEDRLKRPNRRGVNFADLVWGETLLVEMKKRGEHLGTHTQQMLDYWVQLAGRRPAYCMLCNFDEFWIYDFNKDILGPVDRVTLDELPERYGPLAFLFRTGETPVFGDDHEAVTRKAADHLAFVFSSMIARGIDRDTAQRFTLQVLVALFAEDIGLLDRYFLARLLDECTSPERSYDLLGGLFTAMNTEGGVSGGRYKGVDYFNGGLFATPAPVELESDELERLREAAGANWSRVRPEIFGTIFEHSMELGERHAFGAHFTSQLDILKIVKPTITDPWESLIERTAKGPEPIRNLNRLHARLQRYRVLDPACGSGNFLYMAYRELKRIEAQLFDTIESVSKAKDKSQRLLSFVTARQFYGIDINPFAVELAKVTLMIARKLAIDELHIDEAALPLDNLDGNFRAADALIQFDSEGNPSRTEWFDADVIIGNPPFLGAKRLKPERGPDYANAVRALYPEVPGMADYCVYWIRRTHDALPICTPEDPVAGRAGLVGTQNIRNNKSREGGLDHVVETGVIVEAVDNQPWSGEADVHVSIANWIKCTGSEQPLEKLLVPSKRKLWVKDSDGASRKKKPKRGVRADKRYRLVFREADSINAALSDQTDVTAAHRLECCIRPQTTFQGVTSGHAGFRLTPAEARELVRRDPSSLEVCHPYLIGRELVTGDGRPSRWIIDFGDRSMERSAAIPAAFERIRDVVLPDRRRKAEEGRLADGQMRPHHKKFLDYWWQLSYQRRDMLAALGTIGRYICCSRVTKRPIFVFVASDVRPADALQVFAFEDDYSFGVLQSHAHWVWFITKCAKLNERPTYTSDTVFDTFPWPQSPARSKVEKVASLARAVRAIRSECLPTMKGGLRALYTALELPGKSPLRDAHAALDTAVLDAYGFTPKRDILAQLLDLNEDVARREATDERVTPPGIPPGYLSDGGDSSDLISDDCIRATPLDRH
jgi:SAM-dependent methyltransferase